MRATKQRGSSEGFQKHSDGVSSLSFFFSLHEKYVCICIFPRVRTFIYIDIAFDEE